ncbi:MAG: hypothetical protein MJD61_03035 [Proteobacteria bacterium]|nr:hypothetical protein [Pseudomonadota bacterium]
MRPGLHHLDGRRFTDRAGHYDQGQIGISAAASRLSALQASVQVQVEVSVEVSAAAGVSSG